MPPAAAAPAAGTRLSQGSTRLGLFVEAGAARGGDAAPGDPARAKGEQAAPALCVLHGQISGAAADAGSGTGAAFERAGALSGPGSALSSGPSAVAAAPWAWAGGGGVTFGAPAGNSHLPGCPWWEQEKPSCKARDTQVRQVV